MDYIRFKDVRRIYNNTDRSIISDNIKMLMSKHSIRASKLAEVLDMSIHSVYGYTKKTGHLLKPDLDVLLLFALYLDIDIEKLLTNESKGLKQVMINIIIADKEQLTKLLAWRDNNKDEVRKLLPVITEGLILFSNEAYAQYFKYNNDNSTIYHEYRAGNFIKGFSFTLDIKTKQVHDIDNKLVNFDYPEHESIQDMITVHASLMAVYRLDPAFFIAGNDSITLNL